jgi:hypothetical protein
MKRSPGAAGLVIAITACALPLSTWSRAEAATVPRLTSFAAAEVLHLDAVDVAGLASVANVGVGRATGGLDAGADTHANAAARNLDAGALGVPIGLLSTVQQSAPPAHSSPDTATAVGGTLPGVLSLGVSDASASAGWGGTNGCLAAQPLSSSSISTADVSALEVPLVGSLLSLTGTAEASQTAELSANGRPNGGRDVVTTSSGSAAELRLLNGQVQVGVLDRPTLVARASGVTGGAEVTWRAPAITVKVGTSNRQLPVDGSPLDITSPANPALKVTLAAGQVRNVVQSADGTEASADASALSVSISQLGVVILESDLFPLSAKATAPRGGVQCGVPAADSDGDGLTDVQERSGSENSRYGSAPTDPTKADTDGDGIDDGREVNTTHTNPTRADTDAGGVNDGSEVGRGTDPLNAQDDPEAPNPVLDPDGDGLNLLEELQHGTDPMNPDTDGDGLQDGAEVNTHTTDPTNADTDQDGLKDGAEVVTHKSDPKKADTDQDGLSDGAEVMTHKTKPTVADTDRDGLTDGREVLTTKTKPTVADTDKDGLTDGREVLTTKTKPTVADTDRDGISDGREVMQIATKRYKRCFTSPLRSDTDRDGLIDRAEVVRYRTNPCDRDTDHGGYSDGVEVRAGSDPLNKRSSPKHPHRR